MQPVHFMHQPLTGLGPIRGFRVLFVSCAFHIVALSLFLEFIVLHPYHLPPPKSGSLPGAPTLSLQSVIMPPPEPDPVPLPSPSPAPPSLAPVAMANPAPLPPAPVALAPLPNEGLPVLPFAPSKPVPAAQPALVKTVAKSHSTISSTSTAIAPISQPAETTTSNYVPGPDDLPHPSYPPEARDRRETGTVVLSVQFDASGNVASAEVAQSSGIVLLDTATRTFAYAHWHCPAYAGQTKMQPVVYSLENL